VECGNKAYHGRKENTFNNWLVNRTQENRDKYKGLNGDDKFPN
jgi:hypothetical protein